MNLSYLNNKISNLKSHFNQSIFSNLANLSIIQLSNIFFMMLLFPVLTRLLGIEKFGEVMAANAFAGLAGGLVNYGTIQSSIKEVANAKNDTEALSRIVFETLCIRLIFFVLLAIVLIFSNLVLKDYYLLYLFTIPLLFAEVLNPMFLFLGLENLKYLNLANLISKILTLLFVLVFINNQVDAPWVNFIIGSSLSICYLFVLIWGISKYKISWMLPSKFSQKMLLKSNFYLLVNNFSVHLQQSFMLFALQIWGKVAWLGAYALCDKIIWSSRLLIISISNSAYPTAAQLHKTDAVKWLAFKQQLKWRTGYLFLIGSVLLFLFSDLIIYLLSGGDNTEASLFLKLMAFAPFIASLNFMNVLDRVLNNDNYSIFQIAIILLIISSLSAFSMVYWGNFWGIGLYTLTIESIALLLYEIKTRKLINVAKY